MSSKIFSLAFLAFASCTQLGFNSRISGTDGKFYAVTPESTAFYRFGPQQASGPDQKLTKGTIVTLVRPSFGYCKVKLSNGELGFVANEDLGVASADLIAAANPPAHRETRFRFDSSDPRLVAPPEPLPEFEPTPIPDQPIPSDH